MLSAACQVRDWAQRAGRSRASLATSAAGQRPWVQAGLGPHCAAVSRGSGQGSERTVLLPAAGPAGLGAHCAAASRGSGQGSERTALLSAAGPAGLGVRCCQPRVRRAPSASVCHSGVHGRWSSAPTVGLDRLGGAAEPREPGEDGDGGRPRRESRRAGDGNAEEQGRVDTVLLPAPMPAGRASRALFQTS
jgi:hypothetical protein